MAMHFRGQERVRTARMGCRLGPGGRDSTCPPQPLDRGEHVGALVPTGEAGILLRRRPSRSRSVLADLLRVQHESGECPAYPVAHPPKAAAPLLRDLVGHEIGEAHGCHNK